MAKPLPIVIDYPPLFDEIDAAFHVRGKAIFYAWDDRIYNPMGDAIAPEIHAHERVHLQQQAGDPTSWWRRYIADPPFRLDQELDAHRVEYRAYCDRHLDRNKRARRLVYIARRLSGPLYLGLLDFDAARRAILERPSHA